MASSTIARAGALTGSPVGHAGGKTDLTTTRTTDAPTVTLAPTAVSVTVGIAGVSGVYSTSLPLAALRVEHVRSV